MSSAAELHPPPASRYKTCLEHSLRPMVAARRLRTMDANPPTASVEGETVNQVDMCAPGRVAST
jgi:hypothetical protein